MESVYFDCLINHNKITSSVDCVHCSPQLFYWSHKLYWPYYILTVVHATHFWKWLVLPALIFVTEMLLRFYRSHRGDTYIRAVDFLASGVRPVVQSIGASIVYFVIKAPKLVQMIVSISRLQG